MEMRKGTERFPQRLKKAMEEEGVSMSELARRIDTAPNVVGSWIKGTTPGFDHVVACARALNVSLEWLAAGVGKMRGELPGGEFVALDHLAQSDPVGEVIYEAGRYAFRRSWIDRMGGPQSLITTKMASDAMAPIIQPGALLLVRIISANRPETAVQEASPAYQTANESIPPHLQGVAVNDRLPTDMNYLFRIAGRFLVRRLTIDENGDLLLAAVNETYQATKIHPSHSKRLRAIGQIIWWTHTEP